MYAYWSDHQTAHSRNVHIADLHIFETKYLFDRKLISIVFFTFIIETTFSVICTVSIPLPVVILIYCVPQKEFENCIDTLHFRLTRLYAITLI